jgi:MFS family permease
LKSFNKNKSLIKSFLFGTVETAPLENKMLIVAIIIGFAVSLLGGIINFLLGYSWPLIIIPLILGILLVFLFYLIRFKKKSRKLALPVYFLAFFGLGLTWVFNGGYNGANTYVMITVFVFALATSPNKRFFEVYLFFISLVFGLYFFHYFFPDRIVDFQSEKIRFTDTVFTLLYSVTFIY